MYVVGRLIESGGRRHVRERHDQTPDTGHTNVLVVGNNLKFHVKVKHVCGRNLSSLIVLVTNSSVTCTCEA